MSAQLNPDLLWYAKIRNIRRVEARIARHKDNVAYWTARGEKKLAEDALTLQVMDQIILMKIN